MKEAMVSSFPALIENFWIRIKLSLVRFAYFKKRSRIKRYSFAFSVVLIVFLLILLSPRSLVQIIDNQIEGFVLLIFAVTLVSMYGGLGPGIIATLLTAIFSFFTLLLFDLPTHPLAGDILIVIIYLITGFFISIISEARYETDLQKDEFIGLAVHELKNPLASIKGFSELISQKAGKKSSYLKILDFSNEIKIQSDKLLEIINDFLDVTKIEIGKFDYRQDCFNYKDLLIEIVSQERVINPERKIVLSGTNNKIIYADRYRIGQVMTNLISNAVKYSPPGKPIEIKVSGRGKKNVLSVKDHGIGIDKKSLKNIFNMFYRVNQKALKTEGLGLGLFITKKIVNDHGGKIWVKSKEGKGSTFYVELPQSIAA